MPKGPLDCTRPHSITDFLWSHGSPQSHNGPTVPGCHEVSQTSSIGVSAAPEEIWQQCWNKSSSCGAGMKQWRSSGRTVTEKQWKSSGEVTKQWWNRHCSCGTLVAHWWHRHHSHGAAPEMAKLRGLRAAVSGRSQPHTPERCLSG